LPSVRSTGLVNAFPLEQCATWETGAPDTFRRWNSIFRGSTVGDAVQGGWSTHNQQLHPQPTRTNTVRLSSASGPMVKLIVIYYASEKKSLGLI